MILIGSVIFIFSLVSFIYNRKHLLLMLLSLEFGVVGGFVLMSIILKRGLIELIIFYFVLVVCEASLGLSILVIIVFFFGNDYTISKGLLEC